MEEALVSSLPSGLPFMHFPQTDPSLIRTKNFGEKGEIEIFKPKKTVKINGAFTFDENEALRNLTGKRCLALGKAQHNVLGRTYFLIQSERGIYAISTDHFCR